MSALFSGKKLFDLKASHGFPLDFAIDRIINQCSMAVNWAEFIETARSNKWYDFQTFEAISHGLVDADVPLEYRDTILQLFKAYVLKNPMKGAA